MKGMTFLDLLIDAFNKLDVFYDESAEFDDGGKTGGGISASYFGLKANLSAEVNSNKKIKSKKAVILPITPQTLAKYFGEANALWIVEDFHKIDINEKTKLSQVMKIFMDQSVQYKSLKIIAIGAVGTAREVVQYEPEMKNRVAEIEVPLMIIKELEEIIIKGNELLNFTFSEDMTEKIATYSSGLASVTHQLSLLICENEEVEQTLAIDKTANDKTLEIAIDEYVNENSDSLKHIYYSAIACKNRRRYEKPEEILGAILKSKKDALSIKDISNFIKKKYSNFTDKHLRKYVHELTTSERGEILRNDKDSDTFYFSTPFLKAYCYCVVDKKYDDSIITKAQLLENLKNTLHKELEEEYDKFLDEFYNDSPAYLDDEDKY